MPDVIDAILEQSRRNNPRRGITGMLCFSDDLFIQVLEGGRDEVCTLFNTIVRDQRHTEVRILSFEEISERRFGNWTMGQVNIAKVNPSLLLKYSDKPALDPFAAPAGLDGAARGADLDGPGGESQRLTPGRPRHPRSAVIRIRSGASPVKVSAAGSRPGRESLRPDPCRCALIIVR